MLLRKTKELLINYGAQNVISRRYYALLLMFLSFCFLQHEISELPVLYFSKFRTKGVYISPIWGTKTPWWIEPNFWWYSVHDVVTPFKFGDDRFRGFCLAEGQSLPFPIDFEGRPYNIHTTV